MPRGPRLALLLIVPAAFLAVGVQAEQIFVSTTGSDSNAGTASMPVATMDGCAQAFASSTVTVCHMARVFSNVVLCVL